MNTQVAVLRLCTSLYGTLCAWKTYLKSRTKWRSGNKNNHVASRLFQRSADIFIRKPLGHVPAANLPSLRRWASVLISGLSHNRLHLWKFTVNYGTSELCCLTPTERRCKRPATAEINREQIRCATLIKCLTRHNERKTGRKGGIGFLFVNTTIQTVIVVTKYTYTFCNTRNKHSDHKSYWNCERLHFLYKKYL